MSDAWKFQTYIKDYLRTVAGIDRAVGSVLDYLEEKWIERKYYCSLYF